MRLSIPRFCAIVWRSQSGRGEGWESVASLSISGRDRSSEVFCHVPSVEASLDWGVRKSDALSESKVVNEQSERDQYGSLVDDPSPCAGLRGRRKSRRTSMCP